MSNRVAFVVGVGNYDHEDWNPLPGCSYASQEVFDLLINPDIGNCDKVRSTILNTQGRMSVNAFDIYREARRVLTQTKRDEQFIFYFSGHGGVHRDQLFLQTSESTSEHEGYRFSELLRTVADYNIQKALFFIDTCQSEMMINSLSELQNPSWVPYELDDGFGFVAACGKHESALHLPTNNSTAFSHYFCECLRAGIRGYERLISLRSLIKFINSKIRSEHQQTRQKIRLSTINDPQGGLWVAQNKAYLGLIKNDLNIPQLNVQEEHLREQLVDLLMEETNLDASMINKLLHKVQPHLDFDKDKHINQSEKSVEQQLEVAQNVQDDLKRLLNSLNEVAIQADRMGHFTEQDAMIVACEVYNDNLELAESAMDYLQNNNYIIETDGSMRLSQLAYSELD